MAKTENIRIHLVLPEGNTNQLESEFRDRFNMAYERFSGYVGQLEGEKFLSSEIVEDRSDHREDIKEIYDLTVEKFSDADVLMTEQHSPRNRQDEDFLAYTYDVIIRVCNTDSTSPTITQRIELPEPNIKEFYRYHGTEYIILTENDNADLVVFSLDEGNESWRFELDSEECSIVHGFEQGVVLTTGNNVRLLSWEDGTIQWKSEGLTVNGDSDNQVQEIYKFEQGIVLTIGNNVRLLSWEDGTIQWKSENVVADDNSNSYIWEPAVDEEEIYATGRRGNTISRVNAVDGTVEEETILNSGVRSIKFDDGELYVITATEQETDDMDDYNWRDGRRSDNFSLLSLSEGEVRWEADIEKSGLGAPTPYLTSETAVISTNDKLKAYDRTEGTESWSLAQEDFESELGLEESEESALSSSIGRMFELKILNSIGDTIYCVGRVGGGFLIAIDSMTGNFEWENQQYNTIPYDLSEIHEHNENLIFSHNDNSFVTSFIALDPKSGTEEWQFATPGRTNCDKSIESGFMFTTSEECIVFHD